MNQYGILRDIRDVYKLIKWLLKTLFWIVGWLLNAMFEREQKAD